MNPDKQNSKQLLRSTTTVYRATKILRKRNTLNSRYEAENYLIMISQKKSLGKSINRLQTGQKLKPRDAVLQFKTFLDENGVLQA